MYTKRGDYLYDGIVFCILETEKIYHTNMFNDFMPMLPYFYYDMFFIFVYLVSIDKEIMINKKEKEAKQDKPYFAIT